MGKAHSRGEAQLRDPFGIRGKGLFTDSGQTHASMSRAPEEADLCIANFPKNTEK